jgi:hypothetical protein
MRYKAWRSGTDTALHVICHEDRFDDVPQRIRALGPWQGSKEGEVEKLKPHYRMQLAEQNFVVVHRRLIDFAPDS